MNAFSAILTTPAPTQKSLRTPFRGLTTPMASPLAPTFGLFLVTLFLQTIFYGMGLLQAWLYFFWYPKDGWFIKISLIQTAGVVLFFIAAYLYLIDGFGDRHNLTLWNVPIRLVLVATYLTIFIAQVYFARCIYRLHPADKVIPLVILALACGCLGAGIGQVVANFQIKGFQELARTKACLIPPRIFDNKNGIQSTHKVLNYLILTAINRGGLTMVSAALNLILVCDLPVCASQDKPLRQFSSKPHTFDFMLWVLLGGRFYMNSMLATLNTRDFAFGIFGADRMIEDIPISPIEIVPPNPWLQANATTSADVDSEDQAAE
ncbi:hypothetical protein C8R45DRAFT_1103945 [Mycena sanguinolenta]|nr:hypothetical protein C8R45DRAFT_1103945 [Mycena sanguinolenta]